MSNISAKEVLTSLTAIAATLPGVSPLRASTIVSPSTIADMSYTSYRETKDRMKIDTYQALALTPLTDRFQLKAEVARDCITGASAIAYLQQTINQTGIGITPIPGSGIPNTQLVEYKTGASVISERNEANLAGTYFFNDARLSAGLGYSTEEDYESTYGHVTAEWDFNKKNTTLFTGVAVAHDSSFPVGPLLGIVPGINTGNIRTYKGQIGLKQELTKDSYIVGNLEFAQLSGYLGNPYKAAFVYGDPTSIRPQFDPDILSDDPPTALIFDQRPHRLRTYALVIRYVQFLECYKSSFHIDYRFIHNSWRINSHTVQLAYYQPFCEDWQVIPRLRYYTQGSAFFYALSYHMPGFEMPWSKPLPIRPISSSDYRLASFSTINGEIMLQKIFKVCKSEVTPSLSFGLGDNGEKYCLNKKNKFKNISNDYQFYYVNVNVHIRF